MQDWKYDGNPSNHWKAHTQHPVKVSSFFLA